MPQAADRIAALDLIRGVAVLGILAVNIAGFAGPLIATTTPNLPEPGTWADELAFAASLLVFEGKMRALFTVLFGASMLLFLDRAEAAGEEAPQLQMRRLGWLMLLGYLHFALIWWGDILFTYALCGFIALAFRHVPPRYLTIFAAAVFTLYHGASAVEGVPAIMAEQHVLAGTATLAQTASHGAAMRDRLEPMGREMALYRESYREQVHERLTEQRFFPLAMAIGSLCETVPLMLLGMALHRSGFFAGTWPRARLRTTAGSGLALGGAVTLAAIAWALAHHFPPIAMSALLASWLAVPHALMALGYAALLMLAARGLLATPLGARLAAAGRMAFTNYIATSIVMTAIFYGWGLGLFGQVGAAAQLGFVALGWTLMLGWSEPWLARFNQGPLEWLWRSLTYWRFVAFRR